MKRGTLLITITLLAMMLPAISAIDTEVTIKTTPFGNVNLNILERGHSTNLLDRLNADANSYGDITFTVSIEEEYFDLGIYVKKNDNKFFYDTFSNLKSGEAVSFEAAPDDFEFFYAPEETVEETVNETENDTVEEVVPETVVENTSGQETTPGITGQVTGEESTSNGMFSNTALYYIIGIVVLGVAVFLGTYKVKLKSTKGDGTGGESKKIKVKKMSEYKEEQKEKGVEKFDSYKKALEEAEEKVNNLKKEISKIKSTEKIEELKKKMEDDKAELERLQKGE